VAFNREGTRLASASDDFTTRIWDVGTGKQIHSLSGHRFNRVNAVTFSPDGTRLATAGNDANAKVWDANTGKELVPLRGHAEDVESVVFHPTEPRIATTGQNRSVRVWDSRTGDLQVALSYPGSMHGAAFSPRDPRILAAGGDDARLHVSILEFGRESADLIARARAHITANLTEDECKEYFGQRRCPLA
jgi:WD40 repeat protein